MPMNVRARLAAAALSAAALGACADQTAPVAPVARPALGTATASTSTTDVTTLLWTTPVTESSTLSKVIGPKGGDFSVKTGLKLTVPPNAVSVPTVFTVTTLPGRIVAYDFGPHGVTFSVPLLIEQPTKGTNIFKVDDAKAVEGAYYPDPSSLDQSAGTASVSEFRPTNVSTDKTMIRFNVSHFSGYLLSTGRAQ